MKKNDMDKKKKKTTAFSSIHKYDEKFDTFFFLFT